MTQCPECSAQITIADENCPLCNFPVSKLRGLCAATLTQNSEMVATLIQMGADVNSVDRSGRTPLMIAAFVGDSDIVEMLLAAGANPLFTNNAGESALSLAQTRDVERLLRRAIVVLKFSAARKKETEHAIVNEQPKAQEPPDEEITPDIEEALRHLEPVVEPPCLSLDSTQPIPEETFINIPIFRSLDSTQPIPIVFKELEIAVEDEDELFTELEPDIEEDPISTEVDQFIQIELQDIQPPTVSESSNQYSSLTLDPTEESLAEFPEVQRVSEEVDEFIQDELQDVQPAKYSESSREVPSLTLDPMEELLMEPQANSTETAEAIENEFLQTDLHATESFYQTAPANLQLESLDPTEQQLEESEHREIEVPQVPEIHEPVIEEPAPVMNQSPPMQRELQKWEDWKQIEQAAAFAPWKINAEPSDYESRDEIELAQPIDEVIAPAPKPSEVPPEIFLKFTRVRNFAIAAGVAIFLIQILLFMNWPLHSKKTSLQTRAIQAPVQETRPVIPAPKPAEAKPQPKVEVQKEPVAPPKPETKAVAANKVPHEPWRKQVKVKYESEESEPAPVPFKAVRKSPQASDGKVAKARQLNDQGSDLVRAGRVSEGISLLEQAVHTFPKGTHDENYASALLNLGRAWRMAGRPDISIRLLQQRMKINIERDEVARELLAAKRQAVESGMGIRND